MTIKVYNWKGKFKEFDIPDDVAFIRVTRITGDEVIEVYEYDKVWGDPYLSDELDSNDSRTRDFFDKSYYVYGCNIELWNENHNDPKYHMSEFDPRG